MSTQLLLTPAERVALQMAIFYDPEVSIYEKLNKMFGKILAVGHSHYIRHWLRTVFDVI